MNKVTVIVIVSFSGLLGAIAGQLPQAAVTIRVINDQHMPLSDVDASVTFDQPNYKPNQWGSPDVSGRTGKTDSAGLFSAALPAGNHISYGAQRTGWYPSYGSLDFNRSQNGKWQPWNLTIDLTLKQIVNPMAMYARRLNKALPVKNESVAFDLFVGDFVAPHGRGETADMIFQIEPIDSTKDINRRALAIRFPNPTDGILPFKPSGHFSGSALRSPYDAPENGYLSRWTVTRAQPETSTSANYDPQKHGYFFRIRTQADSNGKIISANYGKIYGDFMNFTYYLNPKPNDRNIEFDPKRNLFTNLKPEERVTEP